MLPLPFLLLEPRLEKILRGMWSEACLPCVL